MTQDRGTAEPAGAGPLEDVTRMAAQAAPELAGSSIERRAGWLETVADAIDAACGDLVTLAMEETRLTQGRLEGEVARTTGQLRLFAEVIREGSHLDVTIDHARPDASPPRPDLRRMNTALGPVAVFAAGNFPFAFSVAGGDTASALAAGCPVVVKAHPGHPRLSVTTARIVQDALQQAGAPEGMFALVEGYDVGKLLVVDPNIKAVGFTGSLQGGRALFDLATSRPDPIPFYGELGSLNPVVITKEAARARADELAEGLVGSFTLGAGQFCTKPGIVFVPAGAGDLVAALERAMGEAPIAPMLNERTAASFEQRLAGLLASGRTKVVAGEPTPDSDGDGPAPVILSTSVADLAEAPDPLLTECFGPVTLLVEYTDEEEMLRGLDVLQGTLTISLHAEERELPGLGHLTDRFARLAGRVIFGGWPTGVAVSWAQHHGGPWPSTTAPLHTSVGAAALRRFLRPVAYQEVPEPLLPVELRDAAGAALPRRIDGELVLPR